MTDGGAPAMAGIHHLAITVTDLDRSVPFYTSLFGRAPAATLGDGPFTRRVFHLDGPVNLGLTQHDGGTDATFSPFTPGLDHIGFRCADRAAVEEWAAHLDDLGVEHSGVVDADYGVALNVKDPDGIAVEFFAPA